MAIIFTHEGPDEPLLCSNQELEPIPNPPVAIITRRVSEGIYGNCPSLTRRVEMLWDRFLVTVDQFLDDGVRNRITADSTVPCDIES